MYKRLTKSSKLLKSLRPLWAQGNNGRSLPDSGQWPADANMQVLIRQNDCEAQAQSAYQPMSAFLQAAHSRLVPLIRQTPDALCT